MSIPFLSEHDAVVGETVRIRPGVRRLLADNPGPFTFTGTQVFILGESERVVLIDPGPDTPAHRAALTAALEGRTLTHILVTHHHLDHTAAAPWLSEVTGAPTCGFGRPGCAEVEAETEDARLEAGDDPGFCPDVTLRDGEIIESGGLRIEALHTPGHASNHMCYALLGDEMGEDVLFCGDHVMGWSTSVVTPPDGHMGDYIAQLERIRARGFDTLYPTHGAPIAEPEPFLDAYIGHRLAREAGVLACVEAGVGDIREMVARLYPDLDRKLVPAASLSVLAHLITLREDGRVSADRPDGLRARYAPRAIAAE